MKTFRLFLSIAFLISSFLSLSAFAAVENCEKEDKTVACSVSNFVVTPSSNLCNGELLTLNFTFTGIDFGLNGYTIFSPYDGNMTFQLGDPQSFTAIALCEPNVIFTIFDNDNPNCSATFNYGQVCCDCQYTLDITQSQCIGDYFNATFDYQYTSGSCTNHNPSLTINGQPYSINYVNGVYLAGDIQVETPTVTYVFNTGVPGLNETYTATYPNPCYNQIQLFEVTIDTNNCNGGYMDLQFSINEGFGLNGYIISDNFGHVQFYNHSDPHVFTISADCVSSIILTITDADDPSNQTTRFIDEPICCPCQYDYTIQLSGCDNEVFDFVINIENITGSCINFDWNLTVNNDPLSLENILGTYYYNGYSSNDSLLFIEICNLAPLLNECFSETLVNPCYQPNNNNPCAITNFSVTPDSTSCTGEVISLDFNVTGNDFGDNGYTITTNTGFSQFFNPNDTTQFTLLADCDENIIVTITDANDSLCTAVDTIGTLCCPCEVDVSITQSDCVDGTFTSTFVINNIQGSCVNYDWSLAINGQNYTLNPTNTGFVVTGISSNDSLLIYELCTLVPGLPYCFMDTLFNPCYQPNNNNPCILTNFSVTPDSTSCSGEVISLGFNVTGTDFGDNGYTITTNTGFSQFFNLNDTVQFTLLADCAENIIVTITDTNDSLCTAIDTIGTLCCPCEVDVAITQSDCVDGTFSSSFVINPIQGSCLNYDLSLSINGQNYIINPTNTNFVVTGISSNDSLLIYEYCYLFPSQPECENITLVNPCFDSTVATDDLNIEDLLQTTLVHGDHLSIFNKSENSLDFNIYSINGQLLESIQQLHSHNNISLDISNWPSGAYILKAFNQDQTVSKKLINIK